MASLRDAISAAFGGGTKEEEPAAVVETTVEPTTVEPTTVEPETTTEPTPTVEPTVEPETEPTTEPTPEPTPEPETQPAPASWKAEAKQVWADLPQSARDEVTRRESHVNRVLAENAEVRNFAGQFQNVMNTHAEQLKNWGLPPAQTFETLLQADRMLSTAEPVQRAQYMAKLIKDYQIDVKHLDDALSGAVPAIPDVSNQVKMQVDAALAPFRQQQQAEFAQRQSEVQNTIQQMENNPNYPLFDDVRDEMADLIEIKANRGIYISISEAYNIITGSSPVAKQQQVVAAAKQTTALAQKAKAAASSVGGTPSTVSTAVDATDLRATIEASLGGGRV